jgi:hypothetical protein
VRAGIAVAYAVPPLLLLALVGFACQSRHIAVILIVTLVARDLILRTVKRRFLGPAVPHLSLGSLALELAQPALLAAAFLRPTIQWRTRTIHVRSIAQFEYR